jgi:hypothetical protein
MTELLPPNKPIKGLSNLQISHFWSWAYSDVLSNTIRPLIAEFLVGHALSLIDRPRIEWDAVDFYYGKFRIEVKSSGYVQTWHNEESSSSKITFDIASKRAWDAATDSHSSIPIRAADCYVFCVHTDDDLANADPLDTSQWEFYVMATSDIEQIFGNQKSVRLSRLKHFTSSFSYEKLKTRIDEILAKTS